MKSIGNSILEAAKRFVDGEQKLKETKDPIWIGFLKRESNILLRRAITLWWRLRFGEKPYK